jgi:hypothetical protein
LSIVFARRDALGLDKPAGFSRNGGACVWNCQLRMEIDERRRWVTGPKWASCSGQIQQERPKPLVGYSFVICSIPSTKKLGLKVLQASNSVFPLLMGLRLSPFHLSFKFCRPTQPCLEERKKERKTRHARQSTGPSSISSNSPPINPSEKAFDITISYANSFFCHFPCHN